MESVTAKATKTVEVGKHLITYNYEVTIPMRVFYKYYLNQYALTHLTEFMQNLIGVVEEENV